MILLTIFCGMFSLNQVELFGCGLYNLDDSCLSSCKGGSERKCVTDPYSNTDKFESPPTTVSSCQDHLDQSRLSSVKANTFEAFLVAIKDVASIVSYYSYCDAVSRKEYHDVADTVCADTQEWNCQISQNHVQEIVSHQQCSSQSSGLFPTFLTNLLRCQGNLAGMSLNPERSRDPCDVVKIRDVSRQSFTKANSSKLSLQAIIIATQCVSSIDDFSRWRFDNHIAIQVVGLVIVLPLPGQSNMSWSPPGMTSQTPSVPCSPSASSSRTASRMRGTSPARGRTPLAVRMSIPSPGPRRLRSGVTSCQVQHE